MGSNGDKKKDKLRSQGLTDLVFSWSIPDVMNETLFTDKVKQISTTFDSSDQYLKSFINPLIEETHSDLLSNMTTISHAPVCEVCHVGTSRGFRFPDSLLYSVTFGKLSEKKGRALYEPQFGDLFALTDVIPKCIDDLNMPTIPYSLAKIEGKNKDDPFAFNVLSSKHIDFNKQRKGDGLYAVYLTNLTTNSRIWSALHTDPRVANMTLIKNIVKTDPNAEDECAICARDKSKEASALYSRYAIDKLGLDNSQESAVLNCLARKQCNHRNTVKLIWGPPGTGKTMTVASLLYVLFEMKCRTLTCAPTNIAVLGVATRLLIKIVRPSLKFDTYGLGDIVLLGNKKRMKIDDHDELFDIFLDHRVSCLASCFSRSSGWIGSVDSMIQLLENPEKKYKAYLENKANEDSGGNHDEKEKALSNVDPMGSSPDKSGEINNLGLRSTVKKASLKKVILQSLQDNEKDLKTKAASAKNKKGKTSAGPYRKGKSKKTEVKSEETGKTLWTFEEFLTREFIAIGHSVCICISNLCTHMPTSVIQVGVAKKMIRTRELLQIIGGPFYKVVKPNEGLREALRAIGTETCSRQFLKLIETRAECLQELIFLRETISLPNMIHEVEIQKFCLENSCLIFCTSSSSAKLNSEGMKPLDLLVIDEAAQLKECESAIPLQLPGLRHAVLIGDEKQLPAMVQSKICERADFGRSLFQRLVVLGHKKHLLNVQYRMHPSISLFPNKEFYENRIEDGPNVKHETYSKQFLGGLMYGSYSFIDITCGREQFDDSHSTKNVVEAFVVAEIISKLHKRCIASKRKLQVGCISPYKAQVSAIQEKLGNTYSNGADSNFSVNVRSVDGFQGGEEDIIIISTVRCNGGGSVGFLSNHQRTNVALTRARYCLWILGNSTTLVNSGSFWKKLVNDAKSRGCFFSANEDNTLDQAIGCALIELYMFGKLLNNDSSLFKSGRWKVFFSDEFPRSLGRIQEGGIHKEAISVIQKLSSGWRPSNKDTIINKLRGPSSQLLELCNVKGGFKLAWMVEIQRENSEYFQVIKVLDIVLRSKINELASRLNPILENCAIGTFNRCMSKQVEGNITVPMQWPVESHNMRLIEITHHDPSGNLATKLAAMSLQDEKNPT